jgi:hypothetical protein
MENPSDELEKVIQETTESIGEICFSAIFIKKKLTLTRRKIKYVVRKGLGAVGSRTIDVDEIKNVNASLGPMLGIIYFTHESNDFPSEIGHFWRGDVVKMKRLINGYVIAHEQEIDLAYTPKENLVPVLIKLGTDDPTIKS